MADAVADDPPDVDAGRALELVRRGWGLAGELAPLPSYRDRNYRLSLPDGSRYVLKIAHADEDRAVLEAQDAAMERLAAAGIAAPRVVPGRAGERLGVVSGRDGRPHLVRLVTWLAGRPLATLPAPRPPALLRELGGFLADVDRALAGFDPPALRRALRWDLARAAEARAHAGAIAERAGRARVEAALSRFETAVLPRLAAARQALVHNDANDHNVLVDGEPPRVAGLLDLGDMLHTALVAEVAIALTYVLLDEAQLAGPARALVGGYHARLPLEPGEVALLVDLVEARLCVSVATSARERTHRPDDEYLGVSEAGAWRLLARLATAERDELAAALADACPSP